MYEGGNGDRVRRSKPEVSSGCKSRTNKVERTSLAPSHASVLVRGQTKRWGKFRPAIELRNHHFARADHVLSVGRLHVQSA